MPRIEFELYKASIFLNQLGFRSSILAGLMLRAEPIAAAFM